MNKVPCVCSILRSHSIYNCASPSNSGSTVAGSLFDGQLNDSLLDSLMDPPSLAGLCPPMQVQHSYIMWLFPWPAGRKCIVRLRAEARRTSWTSLLSSNNVQLVSNGAQFQINLHLRCRGQLVSPPCPRWDCSCAAMGRGWMWCLGNTGSLSALTPKVSMQWRLMTHFYACRRTLVILDVSISLVCKILICVCVGRYIRSNLNMPPSLPARSGGHRDYDKDCPITVFGSTQARVVGQYIYSLFWCCMCKRGHIPYLTMQSYHKILKDVALNTAEIMFPKSYKN